MRKKIKRMCRIMSDPQESVKTVSVQVESGSTEHALLTGAKKTRKRRTSKNQSGGSEVPAIVGPPEETAAVAVMKTVAPSLSPLPLPGPPKAPTLASPPSLGLMPPAPEPQAAPRVPVVKIAPKAGTTTQASLTPSPRILPKKRISGAPATETLKAKPKFVVPPAPEPVTKNGIGLDLEGVPFSASSVSEQSGGAAGVRSRTRRAFKERKISLTVQPAKKSRKYRRTLRARVAEMPLQQVRRLLLRKGVIKPKTGTAAPPEEMMRSMLVDYMMLHHAD